MGVKMRNTIANGGMTGRDKGIERVFAYRQGNSYSSVKAFTKPSNPQSVLQNTVRNTFSQKAAQWSSLTQNQRDAWENEAPNWYNTGIFGIKKMSGQNLFIGVNVALAVAGLDLIDVPGNREFVSVIEVLNLTLDTGVLQLVGTMSNVTNSEVIQVAVTAPKSLGTSKNQKLTVLANYNVQTSLNANITSNYIAKYGSIPAGKKIFYEIRYVSAGGNVSGWSFGYLLT